MNLELHFASYEEKEGMYYSLSVEAETFDKNEVLGNVIKYYNSINVEEFLLADAWSDDCDILQSIIKKEYCESVSCFLEAIENIFEGVSYEELSNYDHEIVEFVLGNTGTTNFSEELGNVTIYETIDDYYNELKDENELNDLPDFIDNAFFWLGLDTKFNFMTMQGYNVIYLSGARCLVNN